MVFRINKLSSVRWPGLKPHWLTLHLCEDIIKSSMRLVMIRRNNLPQILWDVITRLHYGDVIMDEIASQITSLTIFYSTVYSDVDQRKHQSSASLAFVRGIHRGPVNSPHKWPVTRKMFPFDDVIMLPLIPASATQVLNWAHCIT